MSYVVPAPVNVASAIAAIGNTAVGSIIYAGKLGGAIFGAIYPASVVSACVINTSGAWGYQAYVTSPQALSSGSWMYLGSGTASSPTAAVWKRVA